MNEWNNSTIRSSIAEKTPSVFHMSISLPSSFLLLFWSSPVFVISTLWTHSSDCCHCQRNWETSCPNLPPQAPGMSVLCPLLFCFHQLQVMLHLAYLADVKRVNKVHIHVYSQCLHIKIKFLGTIRWMKESFLWFSGQRCSHPYWAARARLHTPAFSS